MFVSGDVSYFSRFLVKFIEIIAAGLATAVSGYLIAHFSGALSSPAPAPAAAVIQLAPSTTLGAVEIESRPVAAVQGFPAPPSREETGVFSALGQVLRHDPLAGTDEPPRPPMPVGQ